MLRQITKSVLISKIREDNLMNSKSEWNYFCRVRRTVVTQQPYLILLEVIFHALLSSLCCFEYCDDLVYLTFISRCGLITVTFLLSSDSQICNEAKKRPISSPQAFQSFSFLQFNSVYYLQFIMSLRRGQSPFY